MRFDLRIGSTGSASSAILFLVTVSCSRGWERVVNGASGRDLDALGRDLDALGCDLDALGRVLCVFLRELGAEEAPPLRPLPRAF